MKLNEFLDDTGMPISEFARRAGLSPATVHNVLNGKRDLRLTVAGKIVLASKKKVSYNDLLPNDFESVFLMEQVKQNKHQEKTHCC